MGAPYIYDISRLRVNIIRIYHDARFSECQKFCEFFR